MSTDNLLPFDLEIALKFPERVVTRDRRKVTQLTNFEIEREYPLRGVVDGCLHGFTNEGTFTYLMGDDRRDLFLLPETKVLYQNIYRGGVDAFIWDDKDKAIASGGPIVIPLAVQETRITGKEVKVSIVHTY